jgi:hypothetical protein
MAAPRLLALQPSKGWLIIRTTEKTFRAASSDGSSIEPKTVIKLNAGKPSEVEGGIMARQSHRSRLLVFVRAWLRPVVMISASALLAACGQSASAPPSSLTTQPSASGSVDPMTRAYVSLIHDWWNRYKAAENDPVVVLQACFPRGSSGTSHDPNLVDSARCAAFASAILPIDEQFLADLDRTPAPSQFSDQDQVFRVQFPKVIADLGSMLAAARADNRPAVIQYMSSYLNDMMPKVTDALDQVDPAVAHP